MGTHGLWQSTLHSMITWKTSPAAFSRKQDLLVNSHFHAPPIWGSVCRLQKLRALETQDHSYSRVLATLNGSNPLTCSISDTTPLLYSLNAPSGIYATVLVVCCKLNLYLASNVTNPTIAQIAFSIWQSRKWSEVGWLSLTCVSWQD